MLSRIFEYYQQVVNPASQRLTALQNFTTLIVCYLSITHLFWNQKSIELCAGLYSEDNFSIEIAL